MEERRVWCKEAADCYVYVLTLHNSRPARGKTEWKQEIIHGSRLLRPGEIL